MLLNTTLNNKFILFMGVEIKKEANITMIFLYLTSAIQIGSKLKILETIYTIEVVIQVL